MELYKIKHEIRTLAYGPAGRGCFETIDKGTECLMSKKRDDGRYEVMTIAGLIIVGAEELDPKPE